MAGSKPGERRGGRKRGTPNKVTADARAAVSKAFSMIGDVKALAKWAKDHPTDFYARVWVRTIPDEQRTQQTGAIEVIFRDETGR